MTLRVAWGSPRYAGGAPATTPFIVGASGSMLSGFVEGLVCFGLTQPSDTTVRTTTTFYQEGGDPGGEIVDFGYLYSPGSESGCIWAESANRGVYEVTAVIGYAAPISVLTITIGDGSVAWHSVDGPEPEPEPEPEPIPDSLTIAWGANSPSYPYPREAPFIAGARGSTGFAILAAEEYAFGATEPMGYAVFSIQHTYSPADGSPESVVDTITMASGYPRSALIVPSGMRDGIHTLTAYYAGVARAPSLVFAVSLDVEYQVMDWYGTAAWYEEYVAPAEFWTLMVRAEEKP